MNTTHDSTAGDMSAARVADIQSELRGAGRTLVLATHNVDEGVELATHVAFQRRGRIVHFAPRGGRDAAQVADAYRRAMSDG